MFPLLIKNVRTDTVAHIHHSFKRDKTRPLYTQPLKTERDGSRHTPTTGTVYSYSRLPRPRSGPAVFDTVHATASPCQHSRHAMAGPGAEREN